MNDFTVGLIMGLLVVFSLALTPIANSYTDPTTIFNEFVNVYQNVQPRQWRLTNSTPTATTIVDHEVVLMQSTNSANSPRFYTRIGSTTWFVNLSKT